MNQAFSFKQKTERSEVTLRSLLPPRRSVKELMKNEDSSQNTEIVCNEIHISNDDTAADDVQRNDTVFVDEQMDEPDGEEAALEIW